ncbi:hypothetical protein IMSAGC020_01339 [Lachnospiraceae bacterium]|nr:hypothetical protein IMSAGC020_01339 [Lachnospiraceae bacterium]
MINENYQGEINSFKKNFNIYVNKKIVLYGIGRYTAVLIPAIPEYNIIGLMDRDKENIGKHMYGLPILSKEQVKKEADLIIINTSENYWENIFHRIGDLGIPVFYLNGKKAYIYNKNVNYKNSSYWTKSCEELIDKIKKYDIISFDIFDTLVMWKVYIPQDIYKLIEIKIMESLGIKIDFYKVRLETESCNRYCNLTLDEIYSLMNRKWRISLVLLDEIKEIEFTVTKENIVPRKNMIDLCNSLLELKKVYFISDMYLSRTILKEILMQCGIKKVENLWISAELKDDKRGGGLWKRYLQEIGEGKKALHIGDNIVSDVRNPSQFGIDTYYIMSASDMLKNSSLSNIVPDILGLGESMYIGLICVELFNDPFELRKSKGLIQIDNYDKLGYCIFGGVICSFLLWLTESAKEKNIKRLFFLARDGFFLEKDYLYFIQLLNKDIFPRGEYLAISRRLALISSYSKSEDMDTIINFPYIGVFSEYVLDRFDLKIPSEDIHFSQAINLPMDGYKVKKWLEPYESKIEKIIKDEKKNYLKYLKKFNLQETDAVIDLWYYGNNQFYLSKITGMHMKGFYFAANLSKENKCCSNNDLYVCFQKENDLLAEKCNLYKESLWIESYLTAPYGMIKAVDEYGNYICAANGKNQINFKEKELINEGVCRFIRDYVQLSGRKKIKIDRMFVDKVFEEVHCKNIEIDETLKSTFFYDNSITGRRENPIFD